MTEVAHRAGIDDTTLKNQHHRETRDSARKLLAKLNKSAATTVPKARAVARDKIEFYEDALRKMNAEALKWRLEQPENKKNDAPQAVKLNAAKLTNVVPLRPREDDDSDN